jgi:hypothetical protein
MLFLLGLAVFSFGAVYVSTDKRFRGKLCLAAIVLLACAAFIWLKR